MKLVLIEDQAMIRQLLVMACKQALPEVAIFSAANGAEGVELCRSEQPALVLLDLVPAIREAAPAAKILVLSSHTDEFTLHRVQRSGVNGFVDKNEQAFGVLQDALAAVLGGRSYFCSMTQTLRARMKADPRSFSKVLSDREMELLGLFGRGLSNDDIGEKLGLRPNTVRNHRQNIMTKLGLGSTPQLIHYALEKGFTRSGR